uniref:Uncharacterized protein n=1 Tax=Aegilops tauschii subsp. strangulata TaxID=200361 RepID=A0A453SJH3_AEGTS
MSYAMDLGSRSSLVCLQWSSGGEVELGVEVNILNARKNSSLCTSSRQIWPPEQTKRTARSPCWRRGMEGWRSSHRGGRCVRRLRPRLQHLPRGLLRQ